LLNKSNIYNNVIILTTISIMITISIYYMFSFKSTVFFLSQAFMSIFMIESVNYIEHYGLNRKLLKDGKLETVDISHSWNANTVLTNYFLFKLQRHSDHHKNSYKPYQTLLNFSKAPQLPKIGYSGMLIISLCPPLFFMIMNKRLKNL
jgi:alkane 1-monooxygenase